MNNTPTVANVEALAAWDGAEGDHWTEHADRYDVCSGRLWKRFTDAGLIERPDNVLDIGCGTGQSTRDVATTASSGATTGVDLSARMLERARELSREAGVGNVSFLQADAQVHPFAGEGFDIAISKFGAMFFDQPVAAFHNIRSALRPNGRLALLTWRDLAANEWVSEFRRTLAAGRLLPEPPPEAPTAFALADPVRVKRILDAAGFVDVQLSPLDEPMVFGHDTDDAFSFLRTMGIVKGLTSDLDGSTKAAALDELRKSLTAHQTDAGVLYSSGAWLITARRDH